MWQQEDGRWLLMGTVSHGIKCAYPNLPGVYMRYVIYCLLMSICLTICHLLISVCLSV